MAEVAERSTVEILKAARERITPVERWTTGAFARDIDGHECSPNSERAVCWCVSGATVVGDGYYVNAERFLHRAARELPNRFEAFSVNDEDGHKAVLALVDRAIQLAEQEAK
jgi:hypothetical protein